MFADAPAAETTAAFAAANIRLAHIIVQPDSRSLHEIARLLDAGRLTVTVTRTYLYGEVARAHVDREAVHPGGKAVLTFPARLEPALLPTRAQRLDIVETRVEM
ncbi:zinc-binding dehydrogenase [Leifsonia shinshuensis]|uniref:zinc-binding dehydrogenase n=1 Tax=Leifsonia shinshuensis TaxID=150026 RepID=UPI002860E218|nr:zinc-binding dehydrogenase [Leifsonia shinshuensis]MDR6972934.1 NADPH:quinone reductase-like Zn-dependent oxidoreductase [Leifsonia shinshuensis]